MRVSGIFARNNSLDLLTLQLLVLLERNIRPIMDIRKWLDETVQPDLLPIPPEHFDLVSFMHPKRPDPIMTGKRKRKRSKSDSSLLDLPSRRKKTLPKKPNPPIEESTSEDTSSKAPSSACSSSPESVVSGQRYARKLRRKTRPERYERPPKYVKEREKHACRGQGKTKKSKRKKGEIPGKGIVQNFHAKNVAGDRLTLKPQEKLGIFNKGKTSIVVKGRGLPDLVFSEMKFLQKNKYGNEPSPQQTTLEKKRTKEHAHTREGEISAFFATAQPTFVEQDEASQPKEGRQKHKTSNSRTAQHQRGQPSVDYTIVPTTEVPDKTPYPGFRSREPHQENTSYVSWSESICPPSVTPRHSRATPIINDGLFCSANHECNHTTADKRDALPHQTMPSLDNRKASYDATERFRVSLESTAHQRVSRSHSHPRHISSPQRVSLVDQAERLRNTNTAASASSMPPSVPVHSFVEAERHTSSNISKEGKSKAPSLSGIDVTSTHRVLERKDRQNDAGMEPHTSSSLGRVLQYCNDMFHDRQQSTGQRRRSAIHMDRFRSARCSQRQTGTSLYPAIQHIPTVRFSGVEAHSSKAQSFLKPSIYEQQVQRQQLPTQAVLEEGGAPQDILYKERIYSNEQDEVAYVDQDWDEDSEQYRSGSDEAEAEECDVGDTYVAKDGDQQFVLENSIVMSGFWRPHKLY